MEFLPQDFLELSKSVRSQIIDELLVDENKGRLVDRLVVDESLHSPLINALLAERDDEVVDLLENGADVNTVFKGKKSTTTALIEAARYHHVDSAITLLKHGAEVDAIDNLGETALFAACKSGSLEIVELLVDHGSNVNHACFDGYTPAMVVNLDSQDGEAILQCLILHGADIAMSNCHGQSALDIFRSNGGYEAYQSCNQDSLLRGYDGYYIYDESGRGDDYEEIYF